MFAVKELAHFPRDARVFTDIQQAAEVVTSQGLTVNTAMCASCPEMSLQMLLPHLYAHVYAGMEILMRGKEEWQMCQVLNEFVKGNMKELKEDTKAYFDSLPGKQSVG